LLRRTERPLPGLPSDRSLGLDGPGAQAGGRRTERRCRARCAVSGWVGRANVLVRALRPMMRWYWARSWSRWGWVAV
jgi:hypothetical protein